MGRAEELFQGSGQGSGQCGAACAALEAGQTWLSEKGVAGDSVHPESITGLQSGHRASAVIRTPDSIPSLGTSDADEWVSLSTPSGQAVALPGDSGGQGYRTACTQLMPRMLTSPLQTPRHQTHTRWRNPWPSKTRCAGPGIPTLSAASENARV